jgi:NH3-dependent NAD+ synthetase
MPVTNVDALINDRVAAIRAFHEEIGAKRASLDLSGGIDSAVMAGLLVLALGPDSLTLVYSSINSGSTTLQRASALAVALKVPLIHHDLTNTFNKLIEDMVTNLSSVGYDRAELEKRFQDEPTIIGSIRSCIRAPLGRGYLRMTGNGVRHGTGNECEDRWLRFYQKGGDGEVDTNPINMLSKGEVYQLAHGLGLKLDAETAYTEIINAAPTPELWGAAVAHTDEHEIKNFLNVDPKKHTFYSYIDAQSGSYRAIGLIERVARFSDTIAGSELFTTAASNTLEDIIAAAVGSDEFRGVESELTQQILKAAQWAERATRHKANPNIPGLGQRDDLLRRGILTNDLPITSVLMRPS